MPIKHIAIIGGGYLGAQLAKSLDEKAEVTLIEQNSHFVHASAMIRALVDPSLLDRALIPFDRLLKQGEFIQARAERVDGDGVTLAGGTRIPADYIVVATGSQNALPFKAGERGIDTLRADNQRIHEQLKNAGTVAIVGAGAVWTELAGEISYFMPDKKIMLISDQPSLFPNLPAKFGFELSKKLQAAGVELVFGERAKNLQNTREPYQGTLDLTDGRELDVDLIFPAIGSVASSHLLDSLAGVEKSSANRIKVDDWMRPSALPNIFAAGDVADAGDAMTIIAASMQLPWLEKTLIALSEGQPVESLDPYKTKGGDLLFLPLGPRRGNSQFYKFTAGNFLTGLIKGKDLFIPRYQKLFGRV